MNLKKKHLSTAYLYLIPAFFLIFSVILYPVVSVVVGSFFKETGGVQNFVGLQNYLLAFSDRSFSTAILNNLNLFLCVPVMTLLSLIVAAILFERIPGWRFYRSIIFVPYILAIPAVGIAFSNMMQLNGIINEMLRGLGLEKLALDWLGNPKLAIWSIALVILWKQFGFGVMLFLSRFMSIDSSMFEAAKIDGVNGIQRFFYVIIPQSAAIIEFFVTISLIDMLSWVFSYVHVMTAGGPGGKTYVLEYLIYNKAFVGGNYAMSLAYSVILLGIATLITLGQRVIKNKLDY